MPRIRPYDETDRFLQRVAASLGKRKRPPPGRGPRKDGGGEPVTVEPNRPRQGEGGAAVPLEFENP